MVINSTVRLPYTHHHHPHPFAAALYPCHATQQPRGHVNADPETPLLTRGLRCRQRSNDPLVEGVQPGGAGAAAGVQAGSVVLACCGVGVGGQGQGVRALPSMPLASGP